MNGPSHIELSRDKNEGPFRIDLVGVDGGHMALASTDDYESAIVAAEAACKDLKCPVKDLVGSEVERRAFDHIEIGRGIITSARINSLGAFFDVELWEEFTRYIVYGVDHEGKAIGLAVYEEYDDAVAQAEQARADYQIASRVRDRIVEGY